MSDREFLIAAGWKFAEDPGHPGYDLWRHSDCPGYGFSTGAAIAEDDRIARQRRSRFHEAKEARK